MGRPDLILGQFEVTARCRNAQHGDGVCCAFAPQLVFDLRSRCQNLGFFSLLYVETVEASTSTVDPSNVAMHISPHSARDTMA